MLHLAVDDRGDLLTLVLLHGHPNLGDPWAGGVDDVTSTLIEQLHLLNRGTEGGQNHNITVGHAGKVFCPLIYRDKLNIHPPEMLIHGRVVNDLVGDPDAFFLIVAAGFIGHRHGTLHTPAETEGFRQEHLDAPMFQAVAVVPDGSDQIAVVGSIDAAGNVLGPEPLPVVSIRAMQGSLEGVGVHGQPETH